MDLRIRGGNFSLLDHRIILIDFLGDIVNAGSLHTFKPYRTNAGDDSTWVLDINNNWLIIFHDESKDVITLRYRYTCDTVKAEAALAAWLSYSLHATVIEESSYV